MVRKSNETEDIESADAYDYEPHFRVLDMYFERDIQSLVKHHTDSFQQFIEVGIPYVITSEENVLSEKVTSNKIIRDRLTFTNMGLKPPMFDNDEDPIFPLDAIQKNNTYSSKYTATITQWQDIVDIASGKIESRIIGEPEKDVPIAKIPIMVKSKYCNLVQLGDPKGMHCRYDMGGYFIVNGSEKVVLSTESMIKRKPLVFTKKKQNTSIYYVQVQSRPAEQFVGNVQTFTITMKKDNTMVLNIPSFKEISIFILMRALGLDKDEDIVDAILDYEKEKEMGDLLTLAMNNDKSQAYLTREKAQEILIDNIKSTKIASYSDSDPEVNAQQKKDHLNKILTKYILPHVNSNTGNGELDMRYKAHYIGYMIHRLLKYYIKGPTDDENPRGGDDRDSMTKKRIDTTGEMLATLFYQLFKKMINEAGKIFKSKNSDDKKPPNIIPHIKHNIIEQGIRQALSTGAFGPNRKGISQMLNRMNYSHSASYMRRVITPNIDAQTNKMTSPRHLHNTQFGLLCPAETPEGPKTGVTKNLAMTAGITQNMNTQIPIIQDFLKGKITPLENVNLKRLHRYTKVILNGNWIGITKNVTELYEKMKQMRFRGDIEKTVSLVIDFKNREFDIYTDSGRLYRPLFVVKNNKLNFKPEMVEDVKTWQEFMSKYPDVIEFLDTEEMQNMMLASYPVDIEKNYRIMKKKPINDIKKIDQINAVNRYDDNVFVKISHCEIHPSMMLGIIAANIPFSNHNQSPRVIYQYNQMRQAMGMYSSDWRNRADISYILYHPQTPIVTSRCSKYTGSHIFTTGENAIVAIMSYTGYNQEDSQLMNQSSIDKGLFRAQSIKKYYEHVEKNPASSQMDIFMKPTREQVDIMKDAKYDKLTENGYPKEETPIVDGDVIIGKVTPKPYAREDERPYRDNSTIYKHIAAGAIDRVFTGVNNDGYPIIKLRVRSERIPVVGDKFTSRHSQKGTIGYKPHRADVPFSQIGLIPDIIINPNCMPKRMTIGHLIECLLSKVCAVKGVTGDATPFMGVDIYKMNDELVAAGYEEWANETMYSGMTGVKMQQKIFIGPVYYQRLKQMVEDKAHSRAFGATQLLTRQPPEGRSRDGGLRSGEMERDAMSAHGIAQFLKERMLDMSDIDTERVCDICGLFAHKVPKKNHYTCKSCKNSTKISTIIIPYAFKLFLQELRSMNILGRIRTSKSIFLPVN